ncbi:hypothetical protein FACS189451_03010 [Bacteroidia bacterium]|nr:hypothetical protein FACS189451_03010 [Bacteroidia bacterium]
MKKRIEKIITVLKSNPLLSSSEIYENLGLDISYPTLKRDLVHLLAQGHVVVSGQGKASRYSISPAYHLLVNIDLDDYFSKETDERAINYNYNFSLSEEILPANNLFTDEELQKLYTFQNQFKTNISTLSVSAYRKEMERLAIDLSWKSSQIEGNTYSLLETERLLREKETAAGKTKDEAVMLLNHKEAIDFILENPDYLVPLSLSKIEDIHSILVKELDIDRNIRVRRVGITGTNYRPLDNEFQIKEELNRVCQIINSKRNVFEQAFLALIMISYIQPFNDGNKRTARIVSNAILLANDYCPISFRTVDSIDYKKAMLLFYEQNNISGFKKIFIEQFGFAVNTYF